MTQSKIEMSNGFAYVNFWILTYKVKNKELTEYFQTYELAKEFVKNFDIKAYCIKGDYLATGTHNNY